VDRTKDRSVVLPGSVVRMVQSLRTIATRTKPLLEAALCMDKEASVDCLRLQLV
jgi:hypothetical protein